MCRMSVRGERETFTTRVYTKPEEWEAKSQRILGRTAKVQEQNRILNDLQVALTRHYYDTEQRNGYVTAEMIKNAYMGITAKVESLLPIYKEFLEETEALIGIQKSKKTYEKYERCYRRVQEFIREKYHVSDIAFRDLKPMFLVDFEVWLATKKNCSTNTIYKFLQLLRMPILKAKRMGIVFKDPYEGYKMKKVTVDRGYLTEDEVIAIATHEITIPRLEQVATYSSSVAIPDWHTPTWPHCVRATSRRCSTGDFGLSPSARKPKPMSTSRFFLWLRRYWRSTIGRTPRRMLPSCL